MTPFLSKILTTALVLAATGVAYGQSPERVSSDWYAGDLVPPDGFDHVIFFAKNKSQTSVAPVEPSALTKRLSAENFATKNVKQATEFLASALDQYLRHYMARVESYQKAQMNTRASLKDSAHESFDDAEGQDVLRELEKKADLLVTKFPIASQTEDSLYLAAQILAITQPDRADELASKFLKAFKNSNNQAAVRLLAINAMVLGGRIQDSLKSLASLAKSADGDAKAYATYRQAWSMMMLAQNNAEKMHKVKGKVIANLRSLITEEGSNEKSPSQNYLSTEAAKDLVQFVGDLMSPDDANQVFSTNKTALADAKERIARKLSESNKAGRAIELYRDAIRDAPFSPFAPARLIAAVNLLIGQKRYGEVYGMAERLAKSYIAEKSPWGNFHKENMALLSGVRTGALAAISKWALGFEQMSSAPESVKDLSQKLSKLYIKVGGGAVDKKTQQRMAGLLSEKKDYKAAADAYLKISKAAKPKSPQKMKALRSALLSLDKLSGETGDPVEFQETIQAIPALNALILTHNTEFVSEFPDDEFALARKFSSANINLRFGHNAEAEKFLIELAGAKEENPFMRKSAGLLVVYYSKSNRWKDAGTYASQVLENPEGIDQETIKLAKIAVVKSGNEAADDLLAKKKYEDAVEEFLNLIAKSAGEPGVEAGVREFFLTLGKKGRADLQIKLAEGATKNSANLAVHKYLLENLIDVYESIGEFEKAQSAAGRYLKEYGDDPKAPDVMVRLAQLAEASGNYDLAAGLYLNLGKKYPRSDQAAEAAGLAIDAYLRLENQKKVAEAVEILKNVAGKKTPVDTLRTMASGYALSGAIKTGLEKQAKSIAEVFAKSTDVVRYRAGKLFFAALYNVIRAQVDKEVEETFSDIPIEEFAKVKAIKFKSIEEAFAVLRSTGDEEYIMAGEYELGRLWKEYERVLRDQVPASKKDRKFLKKAAQMAKATASGHFDGAIRILEGDAGAFPMARTIREGLATYFPERFGPRAFPIQRPVVTQHLLEFD